MQWSLQKTALLRGPHSRYGCTTLPIRIDYTYDTHALRIRPWTAASLHGLMHWSRDKACYAVGSTAARFRGAWCSPATRADKVDMLDLQGVMTPERLRYMSPRCSECGMRDIDLKVESVG